MAREIITRIWCDPCMDNDEHAEAEELAPIVYGSMKPRVMAVCETHRKELVDPLLEALEQYGQVIVDGEPIPGQRKRRSDVEKPFACKLPDCEGYGPYQHEPSLRSHVQNQHQISWAQYLSEGPEPSLLDEEYEIPDEFKCGEDGCDAEFDPRNYKSPARARQALGQHSRQTHGGQK